MQNATLGTAPIETTPVGARYAQIARTVAAATWAGVLAGLIVGGVGSRLAMMLLAGLNPEATGVVSDDGFVMGRFTPAATLGLLVVGMGVGAIGGLVYLAVRRWLIGPPLFRYATCGLGAGAVVGSMIVHTDGLDFHLLEPAWLAIALFVAIPGAFGSMAPILVERFDRRDGWFHTRPLGWALAPLILWAFPLLFIGIVLPVVGAVLLWEAGRRFTPVAMWARHEIVAWVVRAFFVAIVVWGATALLRDVIELV